MDVLQEPQLDALEIDDRKADGIFNDLKFNGLQSGSPFNVSFDNIRCHTYFAQSGLFGGSFPFNYAISVRCLKD